MDTCKPKANTEIQVNFPLLPVNGHISSEQEGNKSKLDVS